MFVEQHCSQLPDRMIMGCF